MIDVTDFINADNDVVSFDTRFKKGFRVGAFQKDKSFVNFVKSFPTRRSSDLISFEKGPNDKVFLRSISYVDYAKDSTSAMYKTVMRNNVNSIEQALDRKSTRLNSSHLKLSRMPSSA